MDAIEQRRKRGSVEENERERRRPGSFGVVYYRWN